MKKTKVNALNFTPTQWSSAEDKVAFVGQFQLFVEGGFQEGHFPKWFYNRLHQCFGMIAHYNQDGFYHEYFTTAHDQARFIKDCVSYPCYGSSECTFSDVEKYLKNWLIETGQLDKTRTAAASALETAELAELARLKAKYDTYF